MKTNLDGLFKTSKALETEGVWFEVAANTRFKIARFDELSQKVREAIAKFAKPHAHKAKSGALSAQEDLEISVKTFVNACVLDWEGVIIEGQEVPFNKEKCIELFISLPDLYKFIAAHASDKDQYKEDLGNF